MSLTHTSVSFDNESPAIAAVHILQETERRCEPRYPASGRVVVRSLSPLAEVRLVAKVIDISKGGIRLHTVTRFYPGAMVQILLKNTVILGNIRHSKLVDGGFEHGVSVESTFLGIKGAL